MQQSSVARFTEAPSPDEGMEGVLPPAHLVPAYLSSAYLVSWAVRSTLCAMRKIGSEIVVESVPADAAVLTPQPRDNDDLPSELTQQIEQHLAALALLDPAAALQPIRERRAAEWNDVARRDFSRFIVALLLRHPSVVAQVASAVRDIVDTGTRERQTRYAAKRSDPKTFAEYVTRSDPQAPAQAATGYLQKVLDGDAIAAAIDKMQWARIDVSQARFTLLSSDLPLDIPLNLTDKTAYVALPLSPTALFVASNNPGLLDTLSRHDPSKVVRMMNQVTVERARDCIFSVDDSQLAFVKHHFGEAPATAQLSDGPRQEALATLKRRPRR